MPAKKKLSEKIKKFGREYIVDFNGAKAYIRAGYSKKGAKQSASKLLLTNTDLQAYLAGLINAQTQDDEISVKEIIRDLKLLKDRCMQACEVRDKKGNPTGEWQFDSAGANRSLELLGKHLAMFTDKFQVKTSPLHITVSYENEKK
jgi:phage terminase small subunit